MQVSGSGTGKSRLSPPQQGEKGKAHKYIWLCGTYILRDLSTKNKSLLSTLHGTSTVKKLVGGGGTEHGLRVVMWSNGLCNANVRIVVAPPPLAKKIIYEIVQRVTKLHYSGTTLRYRTLV